MVNCKSVYHSIYEKLAAREHPIKVGVAGAGEFSLELVTQTSYITNMEISVIGDINPEVAVKAYQAAGYCLDDIVKADSVEKAKKYMDLGKRVVLGEAIQITELPVDVVCDITGDPKFGAEFGYKAINNGKHVVVINIESDVCVGPILRRLADSAGLVYTEGDGDQPSLIKGLYDWATVLGLNTVMAGKWTHIRPEDSWSLSGKRTDIGYADGSKNQVEMCCVANMTGLKPDKRGMHQPSLTLTDIPDTFSIREYGGILENSGVIDVVNCLSADGSSIVEPLLGGGVFIVISSENHQVQHALKYKGFIWGKNSGNAVIYRPYHFVGIETPISIIRAVLYNESTGAPLPTPVADAISIAKKDLKPGDRLDGIGGETVRGVVEDITVSRNLNLLPLGLAEDVKVKVPISKGTAIAYDMLESEGDNFIWRLRQNQDCLVSGEVRKSATTI